MVLEKIDICVDYRYWHISYAKIYSKFIIGINIIVKTIKILGEKMRQNTAIRGEKEIKESRLEKK